METFGAVICGSGAVVEVETFGAVVDEAGTTVEVVVVTSAFVRVGVELDRPVTVAVEVTKPDREDSTVIVADCNTPRPVAVTTPSLTEAFPEITRYRQLLLKFEMAAVNPPPRATGESNKGVRATPSAVPVTDSEAVEHLVHVTFTVTVEL